MARTQEQRPSEENKIPIDKTTNNKMEGEAEMTVNKYKQQLAELGIVIDSKNFEKKLRIIAKHFVALADELAEIDNDDLPIRSEVSG